MKILLILLMLLLSTLAWAGDPFEIPFTFAEGDTITAEAFNTNFGAIESSIQSGEAVADIFSQALSELQLTVSENTIQGDVNVTNIDNMGNRITGIDNTVTDHETRLSEVESDVLDILLSTTENTHSLPFETLASDAIGMRTLDITVITGTDVQLVFPSKDVTSYTIELPHSFHTPDDVLEQHSKLYKVPNIPTADVYDEPLGSSALTVTVYVIADELGSPYQNQSINKFPKIPMYVVLEGSSGTVFSNDFKHIIKLTLNDAEVVPSDPQTNIDLTYEGIDIAGLYDEDSTYWQGVVNKIYVQEPTPL